jgi:hypothetical protein
MIIDLPHGARIETDTLSLEELTSLEAQLASDARNAWKAHWRVRFTLDERGAPTSGGQLPLPL